LSIDGFTVDQTNGQVTCPGRHTRRIIAERSVTRGVVCDSCPLRQRCTTSKTGGR
jgi:hypothetical protein